MKKIICYFVIMCFSLACPGIAILPATLAAELTIGEEATLIYSKEVLQETLNDIKNKLDAGFPVTTEIIFLEDIRNELNRHLAEVESAAEEVKTTVPDIDLTEFEINLEEKLDNVKRLIYELGNIIINPTMDQIDSVLELIEILDPEIQGEILATKPELPNRAADTKANIFKTRPVKATGAPVTEADLAETAEIVFTDAIIAKALELNHDVVDIFTWVKFNIDYEPYYGSMKGSNETLVDMAGNDCDTSSLLLALLRASNIPSRYVRGDVELKIEDLMNWTGGKTPEAAIAIMQRNKIPTEVIYKFDAPEGVIFDHIWVEAFDGHNWRVMDPSFKTYVYTEGVGLDANEEDFAYIADTTTVTDNKVSVDYAEMLNQFEAQVAKYENSALTEDEIFGTKKIFVSEKNNLPPYLARGIIGDRKPAEEFSVMPDGMRTKIRVIMPGGNEFITSIPEIAGKKMNLVYVAANDGYQAIIDYYGGIFKVPFPSLMVGMVPVLKIDGKTIVTGSIIGLGLSGQSLHIGFMAPGATDWSFTTKPLTSGSRYAIPITTQKTSLAELKRLSDKASSNIDPNLADDDLISDDMIDTGLYLTGMLYFGSVDRFTESVSKSLKVVAVDHISMGYVCSEVKPSYFSFWLLSISQGSAHIDIVRSVVCPTSVIGNHADTVDWMKLHGSIGTNMEHAVLDIAYGVEDDVVEAVSTGMVFTEAVKQGIALHILNDPDTLEADLAGISAYSVVKNHIRAYVNAGYKATIPQRSVTVGEWSGYGWLLEDEVTGAAGYMICGGLHGETTVIMSGGNLVQAIAHWVHNWKNLMMAMAAAGGIASAGLFKIYLMIQIIKFNLFLLPFAAIAGIFGVLLLLVALVAYIKLFQSFTPLSFNRRRRKRGYVYAYA